MPGFKSLGIIRQLHLFNSLIKPIVLYGCEAWCIYSCLNFLKKEENVENKIGSIFDKWAVKKVQTRFCRYILGLHCKTPILPILGDLGLYPLFVDIIIFVIKYWMSVMSSNNTNTLIYQSLLEMYKSININFNYMSGIKALLCQLGFTNIWENLGNSSSRTTIIKQLPG